MAKTGIRPSRPLLACLVTMVVLGASGPYTPVSGARQQEQGCILPPPQTLIANTLDSLEWNVLSERSFSNVHGAPYREVDVGISGQVEGCTSYGHPGMGDIWFTDVPDLRFPQFGQAPLTPGRAGSLQLVRGIGSFRAEDGSGMHVLIPKTRSGWNGKLFVVQHGGGQPYPRMGELVARQPGASFDPHMSRNLYAALMVDKGYAVAWVRGGGSAGRVDRVVLEDGNEGTRSLREHATRELALVTFAQRFVAERLGERPRLTYYYGFSGGGQTGRLMHYMPQANLSDTDGRIVDGFLLDDPASGRAIPVLFQGEQDVLFADAGERSRFSPQIDVTHLLYEGNDNLAFMRENTRLLLAKGLGHKHRAYEVRGASHFDRGYPVGRPESLDVGGLTEAIIDILDQWVDRGVEPPPSRSDDSSLAAKPAVALPEVACPLGVYYAFPTDGPAQFADTNTTFAPFDGAGLEPLNRRGELVDMNENGVRDERDSVEAAWQRIGLLSAQEAFTPERYAACVEKAAVGLAEERLLPWRVVEHYRSEAARFGSGQ